MKITDRVFHIISNTHWDREWRFRFHLNRQMLVEMIDKVLEILESEPDYRAFHLDSQSIVIEDYLEIKPHREEIISRFVKEKRLFIGPWYVLPDEFQVGGENLIRNLLIGHKICNEIGRVSKTGYSPFSWGQISQLPQIYSNFGIDFVMFYRGVNSLDSPKAEFIWEGADGTRVLASRFSTMPRYNFYFYIYRPVLFNEFPQTIEFDWRRDGILFHFADLNFYQTDYFNIKPADTFFEENIKPQVEKIIKEQAEDFTTPHVIWMEGHDSSGPHRGTIKIIREIRKKFPELNVIHSTLEDYAELVKNSIDKTKIPVVIGERRSTQFDLRSGNLYGYTTSARMDLKIKNFDCERWLQFYAEPFYNIASIYGFDTNNNYLRLAWKLLVQNSSHDSIGGCSLDEVHEDMINRYKHVKEISIGLFSSALKYLLSRSDVVRKSNEEGNYLFCINPSQYERDEVVPFAIDIPVEDDRGSIKIFDFQGQEQAIQIIKSENYQPVLEQMIDRPMYVNVKRYYGYVRLNQIPPFGFRAFKVLSLNKKTINSKSKIAKSLHNRLVLENDFVKVTINKNGTFDLVDKRTNRKFSQLGYFYDEGESGHAWVHRAEKPFVNTLRSTPKIKLIDNGQLFARVLIQHKFEIPERKMKIISGRKVKVKKFTLPINLFLTLTKTSPRIDLTIELNNTGENHRLRILFPSISDARYHYGEGQFDVVKRSVERINAHNWIEPPMYDFPLHNFVDLNNDKEGFAVLVDGLKEYEVMYDKKRTLAITLLRAFSYVIIPSSVEEYLEMKGSQCPGYHKFRLSIYTHSGNWDEGNVLVEAIKFNQPLSLIETNNITNENLTPFSFMRIEPENLIFSCLKKSEDGEGYVLRVYNPTDKSINGEISFSKIPDNIEIVTLEEKLIERIYHIDGKINLTVSPKKIVSIKLRFKKNDRISKNLIEQLIEEEYVQE